MELYRIQTLRVSMHFKLNDRTEMSGQLFLPGSPSAASTPSMLHDVLNGDGRFIAVELEDGERVLWNKDRLMWCRFSYSPGPVVYMPRRRITVVLDDETSLHGDIIADGPPDRRRVIDLMNDSDRFMRLDQSDAIYLISKNAVSRVPSPELGEGVDESEFEFELEHEQIEEIPAC